MSHYYSMYNPELGAEMGDSDKIREHYNRVMEMSKELDGIRGRDNIEKVEYLLQVAWLSLTTLRGHVLWDERQKRELEERINESKRKREQYEREQDEWERQQGVIMELQEVAPLGDGLSDIPEWLRDPFVTEEGSNATE